MEQPGSKHSIDTPLEVRRVDEYIIPKGYGFAWLRESDMGPSYDYLLKGNTLRQLLGKEIRGDIDPLGIRPLGRNLVTNYGDDLIAFTTKGDVTTKGIVAFMAYGVPVAQPTPAKTDTTLSLESTGTGYVRKAIGFVETPAAGSGSISAYTGTWGTEVTVTQAIFELGLFTASTLGSMYNHLGFAVINKSATQTLTLECDVTVN